MTDRLTAQDGEDVQALCANSHAPFNESVRKIDEVCKDVRLYQNEVSEMQQVLDLRMARRAAALQREAAARAAAAASRTAAAKLFAAQ